MSKPTPEYRIYTNFGNIPMHRPDMPEPILPDNASNDHLAAFKKLHAEWEHAQSLNVIDKAKAGEQIEVLAPDGHFVPVKQINPRKVSRLYQIQAGYRTIYEPEGREVLTERGWVAVENLNEGDKIIVRCGGTKSQVNEIPLLEGGSCGGNGSVRLTIKLNPRLYEPNGCAILEEPGTQYEVYDFVLAKESGYECNGVILRGKTEE